MFGKSKKPALGHEAQAEGGGGQEAPATPGSPVFTRPDPLGLTGRGTGTSDVGRRGLEAAARRSEPRSGSTEGRKLVVGREICLSGEIKSCERLVVEGQVEANLTDCQTLEISRPGLFRGSAVVEHCEISGTFEGNLTVNGVLVLHGSGRVIGSLRYGELEIERGGVVNGDMTQIEESESFAETAEQQTAASFDGGFDGSALAHPSDLPEHLGDEFAEESSEELPGEPDAVPRSNAL